VIEIINDRGHKEGQKKQPEDLRLRGGQMTVEQMNTIKT
jgi:hypothetical protein